MDAAVGCEVNFVSALHFPMQCVCVGVTECVFVGNCVCLPLHSSAPNTNTHAPTHTHIHTTIAPVDDFIFWPNIMSYAALLLAYFHVNISNVLSSHSWQVLLIYCPYPLPPAPLLHIAVTCSRAGTDSQRNNLRCPSKCEEQTTQK